MSYQELKELRDLSVRVLLDYSQDWGRSASSRTRALQIAAEYCGINAKRTTEGWKGHPKEVEAAENLHADLDKCWPLGQFEWEEAAVCNILMKHKRSAFDKLVARFFRKEAE